VRSPSGSTYQLQFTRRRPRVAASPDGKQLYLVGGDQSVDLSDLGLDARDHVVLGEAERIVYRTSKAYHNFQPTDYVHRFAEDGGERPILAYDTLNERLYFVGGSYQVKPEGIVN